MSFIQISNETNPFMDKTVQEYCDNRTIGKEATQYLLDCYLSELDCLTNNLLEDFYQRTTIRFEKFAATLIAAYGYTKFNEDVEYYKAVIDGLIKIKEIREELQNRFNDIWKL